MSAFLNGQNYFSQADKRVKVAGTCNMIKDSDENKTNK